MGNKFTGGLPIWVSLISFQKSNISWPQQPLTEKMLKFNMIYHDSTPMIGSYLAPKWPIWVLFCGMHQQKSNFSLLSVGGCWDQPMLLFWKLINETQMGKPLEPTRHHNSRKLLILLPLRAIYYRSLHYETPCITR